MHVVGAPAADQARHQRHLQRHPGDQVGQRQGPVHGRVVPQRDAVGRQHEQGGQRHQTAAGGMQHEEAGGIDGDQDQQDPDAHRKRQALAGGLDAVQAFTMAHGTFP